MPRTTHEIEVGEPINVDKDILQSGANALAYVSPKGEQSWINVNETDSIGALP